MGTKTGGKGQNGRIKKTGRLKGVEGRRGQEDGADKGRGGKRKEEEA
jgi:hypothetical protein